MGRFATAINCMDGRVQGAVRKHMKKFYEVDYVDKITDAGPVRILADNNEPHDIARIKKLLKISIEEHQSRCVAIVAHYKCAGNPRKRPAQIRQLKIAKKIVEDMITSFNLDYTVTIVLLWVGPDWLPQEVQNLTLVHRR